MWKIIKGSEEDFKGAPSTTTVLIGGNNLNYRYWADEFKLGSPFGSVRMPNSFYGGTLNNIFKDGEVIAERVWVNGPSNPRRRKARQKPPVRTQTSLRIVYKGDLEYTLKNVVSVVIRSVDKKVNVTYKEDMGKVVKRVNLSIPFSELFSIVYSSPTRKESFKFSDKNVTNHIKFDLDENIVIQL